MRGISKSLRLFAADDSGATAIEYGLLAALISTVLITFLQSVGGGLSNVFNYLAGCLNSPSSGC